MTRLYERVEKLEAATHAPQWDWQFADVEQCARKKLPREQLELLDQAIALIKMGRHCEWAEAHRAVWDRWADVLGSAAEEMQFPLSITAADMLL
jgi:hypothetical protein